MTKQNWKSVAGEPRSYHEVRKAKRRAVQAKYEMIKGHLTEKSRRIWAATEAKAFGRGGLRAVAEGRIPSRKGCERQQQVSGAFVEAGVAKVR